MTAPTTPTLTAGAAASVGTGAALPSGGGPLFSHHASWEIGAASTSTHSPESSCPYDAAPTVDREGGRPPALPVGTVHPLPPPQRGTTVGASGEGRTSVSHPPDACTTRCPGREGRPTQEPLPADGLYRTGQVVTLLGITRSIELHAEVLAQ